jgi:hypothetical protein
LWLQEVSDRCQEVSLDRNRGHQCGGQLHYPNDVDRSLNESATDNIRKNRADYNNNPPNSISFIPAIASTSGRLHSEFVRLLFLQVHRETDHFTVSGVQLAQPTSGQFHYHHMTFSDHLRAKIDNILVKTTTLRITLNIDEYVRCVDPSTLALSLSSHRHTHVIFLFNSHFLDQ